MGLTVEPIIKQLPARRQMRLDIEVDIFLRLLKSLDGKRRIRTNGLPPDARCVAVVTDRVFNTVSLLLESAEWPEVPPQYEAPRLDVNFTEYYDDAMPPEEAA